MSANNKIKVMVVSFVLILFGVFLFLKNKNDTAQNKIIQESAISKFSMVPANNSLLIAPHSPTLGPDGAPITIVEFLDPECEACKAMYPIVKQLMSEYPEKIRLVVRYLPFHGNSIFAANVLESAREQGKYWEALKLIFEKQELWASHHDPKPEMIYSIIKPLGLDMSKIKKAVESGQYNNQIEMDKADGEKVGATRTPTFFVNGEQLFEMGYDPLKALILKKLN